ncbi:MAG: DNA topoisomerase (ATP-hydrolyzing) subunit A [Bradymonadia bacterium]
MDASSETIALHEATRTRYLNYALSVITSRALPDVRDGLKPVQRRILYAMFHDLKLKPEGRFRKSAAVVGEVMGKYHPHGDQSIYDAMVRMAQPFSLRYPLVNGHGNFGSLDGDAPAAMRYTEAKLRSIAEDLLEEIKQRTVDFRPNYDGQLFEPVVLPAKLPQLLINGSTGIAVGMATNIPPHNLREVGKALLALIDEPELDTMALCKYVKGPDFPTGGEILNSKDELLAIYEKGQGAIKLRGQYDLEQEGRKRQIVITSIPYALNKSSLIEKIAAQVIGSKLPQVVDVRDESTDKVRIVLELKRGANPEAVMAYLYKHTPLQQNFNVNLTCLVPTENPEICTPERLGLKGVLRHFLDFRYQVLTRRLEYQLSKLKERIHILEGLELIFDALDEAIIIIRKSEGKADAARKLMARFGLDEVQVDAILELKLYRLAKLEILVIRKELEEKRAEVARIERILKSPKLTWKAVREELEAAFKTHADPRCTKLVGPAADIDDAYDPEAYIVKENTWVIISRRGRIKRQKRVSEVGAIRVPEGDEVGWVMRTDTRQTVTFFTQRGAAYVLRVADIAQTTGYGDPVQAMFNFGDGERLVGAYTHDDKLCPQPTGLHELQPLAEGDSPGPYGVAVTRLARVLRFPLSVHCEVSKKGGRKYATLADGDEVVAVYPCHGDGNVALATEKARVIMFPIHDIPLRNNAAKGVTAIRLGDKDRVLGFSLPRAKRDGLKVITNRGREILVRETSYKVVGRGGKGHEVLRLGRFVDWHQPVEVYEPRAGTEETTDTTTEA